MYTYSVEIHERKCNTIFLKNNRIMPDTAKTAKMNTMGIFCLKIGHASSQIIYRLKSTTLLCMFHADRKKL
jgi:hypothetical protein